MGGITMTLGRFVAMIAALALAGSPAPRRIAPAGLGTLRTDTPTFGFFVIFAVPAFLTVLVRAPFGEALGTRLIG